MGKRTYTLTCPDDSPIVAWLTGQSSVSAALRYAVEQYITNGGNPPPPPAEPSPPPSAPAIDYDRFGEVVYQAMRQALSEIQIAIPTGAPMNLENMTPEPVKTKKQAVLDDILAGLDEWSTTR